MRATLRLALFVSAAWILVCPALAQAPLPSWNDGPAKRAIVQFVTNVTATGTLGGVNYLVRPASIILAGSGVVNA
jgi:hypothetical protein